ncbi:MAG: hypothetical protein LBK42_13850 [Propionibacteriaceae bacterium]|nr:hypothetical protein [Propionibacteriaceae bacterium]
MTVVIDPDEAREGGDVHYAQGLVIAFEGHGDDQPWRGVTVAIVPDEPGRAAAARLTDDQAIALAEIIARTAQHGDTVNNEKFITSLCPAGCSGAFWPCAHETVAHRHILHTAGLAELDWGAYPDIGESDWEAVAEWVKRLTDEPVPGYQTAYDRLAARAAQWSKDNPEWC